MSTIILKRRPSSTRSTSLIRLERSYATLVQLREKITSYWLEPTTFSMFEAKEAFLNKIDVLTKSHLNLIQVLSTNSNETQMAAVNEQLANVKHIEEDIKEYISAKVSVK